MRHEEFLWEKNECSTSFRCSISFRHLKWITKKKDHMKRFQNYFNLQSPTLTMLHFKSSCVYQYMLYTNYWQLQPVLNIINPWLPSPRTAMNCFLSYYQFSLTITYLHLQHTVSANWSQYIHNKLALIKYPATFIKKKIKVICTQLVRTLSIHKENCMIFS